MPKRRVSAATGLLLLLLGAVVLVGCTPSAPRPSLNAALEAPPSAEDVLGLLVELRTATQDAQHWARLIDSTDPEFPTVAEQLRANLAQFDVELLPAGNTHQLSDTRFRQLGPRATVHAVRVRWAVPGEPAPAEHLVWLTLRNSAAGPRLAGVHDGPRQRAAQPIWWDSPVTVHRRDRVAVIAAGPPDPEPWLAGLAEAMATLSEHDLQAPLVVAEVPAGLAEFEHVLGVRPGSHRHVAATAWPFGRTVRIVVNPDATPEHGPARQVLLTHEAVHAAAGSVGRDVPPWLIEGYADLIALAGQPEVGAAHRQHLAQDQRLHGVAAHLVSAAELAPDHPRVHANYQRAWLAAGVLDRSHGSAGRVHAAVVAGVPFDQALAAEGWTEAGLAIAVHAELLRLVEP